MESAPRYRIGLGESPGILRLARQLPPGVSPRARALVTSWRAQGSSDRDIVSRTLSMFRDQPFTYTLAPPQLGADAIDEFLFETRSGFCEHYASAFTFLMRAAGIPARVVTGYLGGEINPMDGFVVVRQSDAHAWSEVWLRGEGWVRMDPTAAVSPLRVERGLAAAVPEGERPLLASTAFNWLRQIHYAWDAMANNWNQWVLGYSPERQIRFLGQFGLTNVNWQHMVVMLTVISGIIVFALALALLFRMSGQRLDPVQRMYLSYCDILAKRGAPRKLSEGPNDFAARVSRQFPDIRDSVNRISGLYILLRYGGENSKGKLDELRNAIRSLKTQT
jgi:hypothetical protein